MKQRQRYPTDLRDKEWKCLEAVVPPVKRGGRPSKHSRREIIDAILYVVRSGCQWRMLPHDLPPWKTCIPTFGTGAWTVPGSVSIRGYVTKCAKRKDVINHQATVVPDVQLIRCPACGVTNRFVQEKIDQGLQPICGRCKTPVPVDNRPVTVTDATFSAQVERSPLPVLVDMWAAWCGPCQMIAPVLDELAAEMAGRVRFAKLNVDDNPATAERFGVRSIPTMLILQRGERD